MNEERAFFDHNGLYTPTLLRVTAIEDEIPAEAVTGPIKNFVLERNGIDFRPGQFAQVTVFGAGEVPISLSSPPSLSDRIILTVRAAGFVTGALHQIRPGDVIGFRGPCGNGFPIEPCIGQDILFVAGGIGLAPLRGLLWELLFRRQDFGRILLLYGARTPRDLLYQYQIPEWQEKGVEVFQSVDVGDGVWEKRTETPRKVGVVTTLFQEIKIDPQRTVAFVCGPPVMIRFALLGLTRDLHIAPERCFATLERHMKCGVGKCGHCIVADKYVCMDGPVFSLAELEKMAVIEEPW
ncbi:MAG: FAD/NAD(P)-binding protein [Armatimonadetes bacterium]|nr:FAD/NAD(P)-binding protein [Armatimonadota bacterium]MDW8122388.1 FAD/NAD(P)-binding protein [Armatimonadota bacterium]